MVGEGNGVSVAGWEGAVGSSTGSVVGRGVDGADVGDGAAVGGKVAVARTSS